MHAVYRQESACGAQNRGTGKTRGDADFGGCASNRRTAQPDNG